MNSSNKYKQLCQVKELGMGGARGTVFITSVQLRTTFVGNSACVQ